MLTSTNKDSNGNQHVTLFYTLKSHVKHLTGCSTGETNNYGRLTVTCFVLTYAVILYCVISCCVYCSYLLVEQLLIIWCYAFTISPCLQSCELLPLVTYSVFDSLLSECSKSALRSKVTFDC